MLTALRAGNQPTLILYSTGSQKNVPMGLTCCVGEGGRQDNEIERAWAAEASEKFGKPQVVADRKPRSTRRSCAGHWALARNKAACLVVALCAVIKGKKMKLVIACKLKPLRVVDQYRVEDAMGVGRSYGQSTSNEGDAKFSGQACEAILHGAFGAQAMGLGNLAFVVVVMTKNGKELR